MSTKKRCNSTKVIPVFLPLIQDKTGECIMLLSLSACFILMCDQGSPFSGPAIPFCLLFYFDVSAIKVIHKLN